MDSDQLDAFDEEDRAGLERIVALFASWWSGGLQPADALAMSVPSASVG